MPLHVWVREGSSSCGEEPDGNEDLQIQYRTASNTWTTLHTFSGSPSSTNIATQYMTNLPAAALHATTQIRFHQTSGSGTCCDYWFVDDELMLNLSFACNLTCSDKSFVPYLLCPAKPPHASRTQRAEFTSSRRPRSTIMPPRCWARRS